jgi:hypothetical protein
MSDERIAALEQAEQTRRAAMVTEAAQHAGWRDASIAAKVIDVASITTPQRAAAAVKSYSAQNSWLVREPITQESLERQWGAEILRGLDQGGRS